MQSTESTQFIELNCPICENKHKYLLRLKQNPVLYQMTAMNYDWRKNYQKFSREFVCCQTKMSFTTNIEVEVSGIVNSLQIEEMPTE
ncbi:hypothetical protein [Xanthovirga aplysinae]|uniref:hypothetical protein n=1 Tax=Xanthovirga aplysinae TaxID=2529853 RepID=UPI0012BC7548|nr:hypothetical protein [Xanthovirga aplysinae]MTI32966.1 hypothetical protein [Xanthovirga aplysinae]